MRIAQLISASGNGAANHGAELTSELSRRGHDVTLVVRDLPNFEAFDFAGAELLQTSFQRTTAEFTRVRDLLRARRIEVVHTHSSSAHSYGLLLRLFAGMKVVAAAQSRHIQLHWIANHRVIAASAATAAYHHRYNLVPWRKLRVVHNFVPAANLTTLGPEQRTAARAVLGVPDGALVLGSIGHIDGRKNQSGLIKVLAGLRAAGIDAWLVLVGKGGTEESRLIDREAAAAGVADRLVLTGARRDVRELLPAFDIYVQNSRSEELPLAMLEAMAAALPVISTAVGGIPEVIDEGVNGHLVEHGDYEAFVRHAVALARSQEQRAKLGRAARQKIINGFHPDIVVPRIEAVLAEVTGL